jgi:hypothetical protein
MKERNASSFILQAYPRQESNDPHKTREKPENGNATARQTAHFPPDLQRVIDAWPKLAQGIRGAILELVQGFDQPGP